jgi:outer membrane receptor for ferrienterochelin and colicins
MGFRKYMVGLIAGLTCHGLSAQVSGRVVEVSKDTIGLAGAVIQVLNVNKFVVSDSLGYFLFDSVSLPAVIKINYVGYISDSIEVKNAGFILKVMKPLKQLNEVEVVHERGSTEISFLNPQKIETLTERSLMKAACCNLSESFETNASVDVNFADAVSGAKQIQMLGLSGRYAQITKENMPYLRGLAAGYGLAFIPGPWIESIQLGKGAGSVVNGYESFTGQINTELRHPDAEEKLHFNTYVNENLRNEYNLNLAHRVNDKFSAGLLSHISFNPLKEDRNKDGFLDIPTGQQQNFLAKFNYNNNKNFEAQFGGGYLNDERVGGQNLSFVSDKNLPLFNLSIQNKKWELYSKTGYVFRNKPGTSMGLQLSFLNHDLVHSNSINEYSGIQKTFYANYIFQGIINNTNHVYKVGASFLNDDVKEKFNLNSYNRLEQVPGVFGEYTYTYKNLFNVVAGLRGDYHNFYGAMVTPRLHIRRSWNDNKTVARVSGGSAWRTASIYSDNMNLMASNRQWLVMPSDFNLPYGLKPEYGWNYGFNFTQKFNLNYREAYITLDVYRTQFNNQVITDLDLSTQQVNIYNVKGLSFSNTAQVEFNWEIRKRLFIKTAYRWVDSRQNQLQGVKENVFVSRHRAFVNFEYATKKKHWLFDATAQYNGSKRLPDTKSNPEEYTLSERSPEFYNVLGQITYATKIYQNDFNIYLGVENALNFKQDRAILAANEPFGKHFDAGLTWGPVYGRMLYLGLRFKVK